MQCRRGPPDDEEENRRHRRRRRGRGRGRGRGQRLRNSRNARTTTTTSTSRPGRSPHQKRRRSHQRLRWGGEGEAIITTITAEQLPSVGEVRGRRRLVFVPPTPPAPPTRKSVCSRGTTPVTARTRSSTEKAPTPLGAAKLPSTSAKNVVLLRAGRTRPSMRMTASASTLAAAAKKIRNNTTLCYSG